MANIISEKVKKKKKKAKNSFVRLTLTTYKTLKLL